MKKRTKIAIGIIAGLAIAGGCGKNQEEHSMEKQTEIQEQSADSKKEEKNQNQTTEESKSGKNAETAEKTAEPEKAAPSSDEAVAEAGIRPEFKASMDEYVAFYEDYARFMKNMQENPSDPGLLMEMSEWIDRLDEMDQKLDMLDQTKDDLSTAELNYYIDCTTRIYKLLSEASM